MGREVLRSLGRTGHAVRLLSRNPSSPAIQRLKAECSMGVHAGDVSDEATLAGACDGVEDNTGDAAPANTLFGLRHTPFRDGVARQLNVLALKDRRE